MTVACGDILVAKRFIELRANAETDEAAELLHDDCILVPTIGGIVYGRDAARIALLQWQRYMHLKRKCTPLHYVKNSMEAQQMLSEYDSNSENSKRGLSGLLSDKWDATHTVTPLESPFHAVRPRNKGQGRDYSVVEREGRYSTSFANLSFITYRVRETFVIEDGRIRLFVSQRIFR